jgi:Ca2+-binding RTX toxin-like protein
MSFDDIFVLNKDWDDYWIKGIAGNDTLTGGNGDDKIDGGVGDDRLMGGYGKNELIGGDGIDTLDYSFYGFKTSVSTAGLGVDIAFRTHVVNVIGGAQLRVRDTFSGIERAVGSSFNDTISGDDSGLQLWGGRGNDTIASGSGKDWISGGKGNDVINGGLGKDSIYGGNGNDDIKGGVGADKITGGLGGDRINNGPKVGELDKLYYGSIKDSTLKFSGRDVINFEHKLVFINLEAIDADTRTGHAGDQDFHLIGHAKFSGHGHAGELRFVADTRMIGIAHTTLIQGDVNGDGTADFAITVIGNRGFVNSDFDL